MQRSTRDSDEDVESRTGRRTRTLTTQSVVDSPIRRSSRIKQSIKKLSPDSESDTSTNSQPVRTTRQRTATMDSITTETLKGRRVRKSSISSEASEILDTDIGTPSKRITRRSFITATLGTPTRASTRATSKHFVRAGSETKSPPPSLRTTRRTRASSVDPETMSDQNKCTPNVSTKIRKRASVLPSQSPVKEEIEEKQQESDKKIVVTLPEVEEFTSSVDEIACSKENQKAKEIDNTSKDKVEDDNSGDETILTITLDETSQQLADNEIQSKHTDVTIADKIQSSCTKDLSSDIEIEIDDEINYTNVEKDTKGDKSSIIENEEYLTEVEDSQIDMCKKSPTKELTVRLENIFETSVGPKRSPSNKENQTLNIINDISAEKNTGPIITNVTSLNTKSLTTVFVNKSLTEKEIKCTRNESSLSKRRHSRESTETVVKHTAVLKESTDNIEEITDSSTDPLNPIIIHEKKNLDSSSVDDTTKRQSLVHDVDKKSTTNDTVKQVSLIKDTELVEEMIDDHIFVETVSRTDENTTKMANKLDRSVMETCNKTIDSRGSSCSSINNSEIVLELEESNASQDNKSSNVESMKTMVESNLDHSNESIDVETCDNKSTDKVASITQDKTGDDLLESAEQIKNLSDHITKSTPESSSAISKTINSSSSDLNIDNSVIKNIQFGDIMKVSEESTADMSRKEESMNTSLKITMISTQRENENTSALNIGEKSTQLDHEDKDQEDSENMEIDDDKSDVDIVSMFRDIPADEWKKDVAETKKAVEDKSNLISVENESEAECDLVLVDKQAWLAAESIKAVRDKECFEYDSDDTVLLKSKLDVEQANSKKRLSAINEALLINIDDDDEEEEDEEKEGEEKAVKPIKTRKSSIKRKSVSKDEDSSTICIDVDSSNSIDKFLNKSEKYLNRSSSRGASRLNKSGQTSDESDDEIGDDSNKLNRSLQARKNTSLRKSTEKRVSLNKSSKETPSRQSLQIIQNNSVSKSQANNSEEELDSIETYTKRNLKKKMRSLGKLEKREDVDIDEVESGSKKSLSSEESGKEDKDENVGDSDENDEDMQNKDLKHKKSNLNCSTLAIAGSVSNNSSKLSDSTEDSLKHCEYIASLFELESDTNNDDDDGIGSINSDIKREYNLDASEQEYSDNNVPYDECRTSESESSDLDDTGSDLADFIVADDAIEGEKYEEEGRGEQNDEDDEQEKEEVEAAEQEEVEDKNVDDEQVEDTKENDSTDAEEDKEEKSVETKINVSKNNTFDKSLKIGKNKRKISTEHIMACQPKKKEDIQVKKSHTKKVEETNIIDTSDSIKKKRKSYVDETEQDSIKQLNKSEINRKKLVYIPVKCSTPKINSSEEEFANDVETTVTALGALEAVDEKLNSMSERTQHKKKKSRKDSILKDLSFKEPKHTNNKEKLLHTSLPSDVLERVEKARPMSKMTELSKTMNVTHTETPTIRDLRKEKLNESAPELKLSAETSQLQKRRLSKEKSNIAQKKTNKVDSDEEIPNLIALFNDNIQEPSQRKQKKRKKQVEETSNENITENDVPQDATESDISKQQKKKKKKEENIELSQVLTAEDTIRKDTCRLIEKKKKKIHVIKTDENAKDDIQQENIRRKEKGTLHIVQNEEQHKKKKKKRKQIVANVECDDTLNTEYITFAKKKDKQQKIEDSTEYSLPKKSLKKKKKEKEQEKIKKKEKILSSQTETLKSSKSKSAKKTESEKSELQNVVLSKTVESKNAAFIKARSEALEAIKSATERIKLHKKLKKKKQQEDNANMIQEQVAVVPIKRKKPEIYLEEQKQVLPSSTGGLKRLPDNVIDKLLDVPTRVKKRKFSKNTEQVMPSLSMNNPKFLETKVKNRTFVPLSSNGGTTQFAIVNMSKPKKQSSKAINSIISYKQRMLNKNSREPVSSYLMYLQKQHAVQKSAKDGFSDNAF
ncbi:dentin sialophosphoprotein-like isoform X2 [Odontomachus brunneus]|uniref:dentin sialophosphoprotein-like isoform X2 n=1 Tax=Odontomachus brunneus TaxID=486640 RepID=UPI0013F227FA|nr:dentin sialophosphoprotein-like isoform X2 [Odontomachus brunneus]